MTKTKYLINSILLISLFIFECNGQTTWDQIKEVNLANPIYDLCFVNNEIGFAVNGNIILKTANIGLTWKEVGGLKAPLRTIHFSDTLQGWAAGMTWVSDELTPIYRTNDGGESWILQLLPSSLFWPTDVFALNENIGYVSGHRYGPVDSDSLNTSKIFKTSDGGETWKTVCSEYGIESIWSVYFPNMSEGWAVGSEGLVLYTNDTGETWGKIDTETEADLFSVFFINDTIGWIAGRDGTILKTVDRGINWQKQIIEDNFRINMVYFKTDLEGFCLVWHSNTYFYTSDGGLTWEKRQEGFMPITICFLNDSLGFIGTSGSIVMRTTDSGGAWQVRHFEAIKDMNNVNFRNDSIGWIVGNFGKIYITTDAGNSWYFKDSGTYLNLNEIDFASDYAWIVGDAGLLLFTPGYGDDLIKKELGIKNNLSSCCFIDSLNGWIAGDSIVLHTSNGGLTWDSTKLDILSKKIRFFDESNGFVIGKQKIFSTYDGGITWHELSDFTEDRAIYWNIFLLNKNQGWIVGNTLRWPSYHYPISLILYTGDRGVTWDNILEEDLIKELYDCYFLNADTGYLIGSKKWSDSGISFSKTIDGGRTWQEQSTITLPSTWHTITDIHFVSDTLGFCVGETDRAYNNYLCLRVNTRYEEQVGIKDETNDIRIRLYPNPVNDILTIDLSLFKESKVNIRLFSQEGTLVFHDFDIDTKSIFTLNMTKYRRSIYILEIQSESFKWAFKIIKL